MATLRCDLISPHNDRHTCTNFGDDLSWQAAHMCTCASLGDGFRRIAVALNAPSRNKIPAGTAAAAIRKIVPARPSLACHRQVPCGVGSCRKSPLEEQQHTRPLQLPCRLPHVCCPLLTSAFATDAAVVKTKEAKKKWRNLARGSMRNRASKAGFYADEVLAIAPEY